MEAINNIIASNLKNRELDYKLKKCDKCGDLIEKEVVIFGSMRVVPLMCSCRKKDIKDRQQELDKQEKQLRLNSIIKNSLMDEKFKDSTFDNWDKERGNKKMYNIGTKYADSFLKMKEENVGLLIYGNPGNGKSYTTACIANKLINDMVPVVCVSIDGLLKKIQNTYNSHGKEGEDSILRNLANAELLIIDDLGTEHYTEWSATKIYNILDSRYRNQLPLIVTTNFSLEKLKQMYHERTFDRLLEMCTPVLNDGKSIRVEKAKEKTKILKNLLEA